jgi:hypothetical protein
MKRRHILRGIGGILLALPLLEGLSSRNARAAKASSTFAIFVRQGNGVQQLTAEGEPERFWPSFPPGPMTQADLAADGGRALSVLANHAQRLTFVRGIRFNDPANACRHSGGGNQVLTAARVSSDDCNSTLALGESIDNRIVRHLGAPGDEPLTLYAGRKTAYLDEVLSYRGPRELRAAERNPYVVYKNLFGLSNTPSSELAAMYARRRSVNDLVRSEMQELLARKDLSKEDRRRLDLHFTSIRDLEKNLTCNLDFGDTSQLQAAAQSLDDDDSIETVLKLHMDLLVLAVACGLSRSATLQIGCGPDATRYWIDGVRQVGFHEISHRGDVPDAALLHSKIDRKLLGFFNYLLDKLAERSTPNGPLLDQGLAVYVNDLATGSHSYDNVPYLLAGGAGGFLRTGLYVDAGGVTNNKILNTIGAAVGCTNAAGAPLDDFGDPALEKGRIEALIAPT